MSKRKPKFGATGKFPQGKLTPHDEGEIRMGIAHDDSTVILNFGKPTAGVGMDPTLARQLAANLIEHADAVDKGAH